MSLEEGYGVDFEDDWDKHLSAQTDPSSQFYSRRFARKINLPKLMPYEVETPKEQGRTLALIVANIYYSIESLDLEGSSKISSLEWDKFEEIIDANGRSDNTASWSEIDFDMESQKLRNQGGIQNDSNGVGDYSCYNLVFSTKQLLIWLKMKYDLPVDLRIKLIQAYYSLCTSRGQRIPCKLFLGVLKKLTQDLELLKSRLVLPHQNLLDQLLMHFEPDKANSVSYQHNTFEYLVELAHLSSPFFDVSALPVAFSSLGSKLSIFNASKVLSSFEMLPIRFNETGIVDERDIRFYFEAFFFILAKFKKNKNVTNETLDILGRVAKEAFNELASSGDELKILGNDCGLFSNSQIESIFDILLNGLDISHNKFGSTAIDNFDSISSIIVFSITNDNIKPEGKIYRSLGTLFNALQSYVYPSNSGKWSSKIANLIVSLSSQLLIRFNGENELEGEWANISKSHKLSKQSCENFINLMLPVLKSGIHSKYSSKKYESSLSILAHIKPHLVLQSFIIEIYDSLEDLVYTHRVKTALKALRSLARYFTQTPVFRVHVTNFMMITIKNMDPNDLEKMILILEMLTSFATYIPFSDISEGLVDSSMSESFIYDHLRILEHQRSYSDNWADEISQFHEFYNEIEALKSSTVLFKSVVDLFCNKLVTLFEILEDESDIQKVYSHIHRLMNCLLDSMSDKLVGQFRDRMLQLSTDRCFYKCSNIIGCIFSSIVKREPKTFDLISELTIESIKDDINDKNAGTSLTKDEMRHADERLFWNISILNASIGSISENFKNWEDELLSLSFFLKKSIKGVISSPASNLVSQILQSLIKVRIVGKSFQAPHSKPIDDSSWGYLQFDNERFSPYNLSFEWYIPGKRSIACATEFFSEMSKRCLLDLNELVEELEGNNNAVHLNRIGNDIYPKVLFLIKSISGISWMIDPEFNYTSLDQQFDMNGFWKTEKDFDTIMDSFISNLYLEQKVYKSNEKGCHTSHHHKYKMGALFYSSVDDDIRRLYITVHSYRYVIGKYLVHFYSSFARFYSENSKLMKSFVSLINFWISDVGCERLLPASNYILPYESLAKDSRVAGVRKPYSRVIIASRISSYHLLRVSHTTSNRRLQRLDRELFELLVDMSFSSYQDVSLKAHKAILGIMKYIGESYYYFIQSALRLLQESLENKEEKRVENGLSLLNNVRVRSKLKTDYTNIQRYLVLLRRCSLIDSLSIENLVKKSYGDLLHNFNLPSGVCEIELSSWHPLIPLEEGYRLKEEKIRFLKDLEKKRNLKEMNRLVDIVTDETNSRIHWGLKKLDTEFLGTILGDLESLNSINLSSYLISECSVNHIKVSQAAIKAFAKFFKKMKALNEVDGERKDIYNPSLLRNGYKRIKTNYPNGDSFYHEWKQEMCNVNDPNFYIEKGVTSGWLFWDKNIIVKSASLNVDIDIFTSAMRQSFLTITAEWILNLIELWNAQNEFTFNIDQSNIELVSALSISIGKGWVKDIEYSQLLEMVSKNFVKDELATHMTTCNFIAGILLSSGYIGVDLCKTIDSFLHEFFVELFFGGINSDNKNIWRVFVLWYSQNVDYRYMPKTSKVFHEPELIEHDLSSIQQAQKISYLSTFLIGNYWSFFDFTSIFKYCSTSFTDPSLAIREEIGVLLSLLSNNFSVTSTANFSQFLKTCNTFSDSNPSVFIKEKDLLLVVMSMFEKTDAFRFEINSTDFDAIRHSKYAFAASSLVVFLRHIHSYSSGVYFESLVCDHFLPFLFNLMEFKSLCQNEGLNPILVVKMIAQSHFSESALKDILSTIRLYISDEKSVVQLYVIGEFVEVFFFKNLNRFTRQQRRNIIDLVESMFQHQKVEVREAFAHVFSGLIYLLPPQEAQDLIEDFTKKYDKSLDHFRSVYGSKKFKGVSSEDFASTHGSILGLGALIHAFNFFSPPPPWIPKTLDIIFRKASGLDGILGKSGKEVLTIFKKSRSDTWHLDSKIFSSQQLEQFEGSRRSYFV